MSELFPGYDEDAVLASAGFRPRGLRADPYAGANYVPDVRALEDANEVRDMSELGKGYKSTRLGLEASYLAAEESSLRAKGNDEAADLLVPRRLALEERAGLFAPKESSAYDLKDNFGLRRGADWAAGAVGGMGASLVDSMATGVGASALARGASTVGTVVAPFTGPAAPLVAGASRLLGAAAPYIGEAAAFVPNYLQAKGSTAQSAWKDPELMARTTAQERDNAASLSGVGQAALDTLIPGAMRRRMMGENLYGAAERSLNRLPLAAGVALDSLGEGAQEVVQDRMEKAALSHLNPDRDTSGDWKDAVDNFAAGAVGSAPMAAGSRYMGKGRERLGAEGDGKNGDVIDLNAPDEKPKGLFEELGGKSRYNERERITSLLPLMSGETADPAKIPEATATQKATLIEELSKLSGKAAEEHLRKVSAVSVEGLDAIENNGAPEFMAARDFVIQKNLMGVKRNAERPDGQQRLSDTFPIPEGSVEQWEKAEKVKPAPSRVVDPKEFKFDLTPDMFTAGEPEQGVTSSDTSTTINERLAKNKVRMEQAQQKAKLFNTRAELITTKLWTTAAEWHGEDAVNIDAVKELTQEVMATTTVKDPSPADERRAQRVAEQLVHAVGPQSLDVLQDIWRITGGSKAFRAVADRAAEYANATSSAALRVQHETRDAAAVELTKLIPAEVEMRLAKDHGVDLSSNKDRNDLLDLMESVADGKASVPRIKLNKLFSKPVVDAMEEYLGKTIMPRLEGVRDDLIDESDDYGSKTQTGNTEGEHNTEQSIADPRDLTSDGEATEFDLRQLGNNLIRVKPDSQVFHLSGDARGSMVNFSDAWKENDDGRLPKLIYPGPGQTQEQTLGHVQKLVAKATERLGPEQRDRYVMGNPASKDPMEAAGATSAKKILDDSNVPDDQRLKLMMRYMEQEDTKGKQDFTEAHERMRSISYLESVDRALTDIVAKRESVDPYGRKLSIDDAAALKSGENQTPFSIDIPKLLPLLTPKDAETAQSLWASRQDVNTKVSQEELFRTMAPIVHRAKEVARQHLSDIAPGADRFFAKNPSADLKDYVNDFFSQRYAVVAEQPTDRDYLQMNLAEFNDMAKKGKANLNSAWVTAGDDEAEQNKVKAGMNIIHFKSRHSGTGEVAIPAYKLVKWVRSQENAHTDDKRENATGSGSQNAQYDSYLDALKQGITALHMGGLTEGLPWIVNAEGKREEFTPAKTKGSDSAVGGVVGKDGDMSALGIPNADGEIPASRTYSGGGYSIGKEMSYRKAGKTEVENGWVRTGLGDLPPSLDVGGTSYADYKRSKAHGAMHKRGAASSEETFNPGLVDAKAEEEKNAELSQDEKNVQGEEAVDEAMAIDQGSRTREEERKHLKLMSSVMRAAADHLPKALTVGAAVNKAGKVAEQLWRDYTANREAGLERIFGYVRSMRRPSTDDSYGYNKELGELWREFHAADDSQDVERGPGADRANPGDTLAKSLAARFPDANSEHLSDLLSRGVQTQNDPQGRGAVDTATTDKAGNVQRAIVEKAAAPKEAGHWGVGGVQYAFPLAALLTPRNIANAHPDDQATFKRLRSAVAAEIMRAAVPDPKTPKLPPALGTGQVRKLVNALSGYNDQKQGEKLDKAKAPGDRALLERSKLAPVATSFVPNGGMKRFLQGLSDTKQGDIDLFPQSNNTFEGENRTAAPLVRGFTTYERERAAENFINAAREYGIVTEDGHLRVTRPEAVKKLFAMTGAKPEDVNHMLGTTEGRSDAGVKPAVSYSRGEGSTLAEREDARKVGTKEPSKVTAPLLKNPPKAPAAYQPKETAKLLGADRVIAPISPEGYAGDLGRAAQAEGKRFSPKVDTDMSGKVVLVSVPGKGRGFTGVDKIIEHVKMALDRGATVRTDSEANATRTHNAEGEGALRQALIADGYTEAYTTEYFSAWQKVKTPEKHTPSSPIQAPGATTAASEGVGSQNALATAIAKHQEYLKNPPADYTTERAAAIGTWAEKQHARVVAEMAKTDDSTDQYDRLDDLRFKLDQLGKASAAKVVESTEAEEHERKYGPQGAVKRNAEAIARQTEAEAANQFAKLATMAPPKHIEVTSAIKYFERNVSDKVKLILQDVFPGMKGSATFDTTTNIARISTANPLRIMRLAYHEAVHGFFNTILKDKGMEKARDMLLKAMSEPKVYERLKELLKGETEALADMERDPEERVAYAFQFWKLGLLDIDDAPKTFFEQVQALMRRVFGAVRDSEKALAIFTAFDQGQLKETSAAGRAIEKIMSQGEWHKELLAKYDKQAQALYTEAMANYLNFRNSESITAKLLGRMWYSNPAYGADTEQVNGQDGVINRTKFKRDYYSNRIRVALKPLQGPNLKRDLETLAEALNNHTEPTTEILRKAKKDLQGVLTEYRTYAKQAGLDIGEQLGADGKYWPRVYEIEKLINGRENFVNMLLTKHGKLMTTIKAGAIQAGESGIATERDVAEMIHQSLVDRLGVQDNKLKAMREDGVLSPFFASMNKRTLEWLSDEDVAPYLSKDVIGTMTQYISQGVRAAEYTRTFGEDGKNLRDMLATKGDVKFVSKDGTVVKYEEDGPIRSELVAEAENKAVEPSKREEWVERRMEDLKRASGAMEGSLGKDISATARQIHAGAMTFQIVRLLPFMIFSSMLDANGIRVAGGEWEDAFNAYKRGFTGLWNNWKDLFLGNPFGMRDPDEMEKAALASGVINSDMENEEMGEVHSSEYSSGLTRHINHVFFKAIGISQWDRDMRIVATDAARKAIVRDYNNAVPEHSARWLRELGLKKDQIFINDKNQLVVSAAELMKMKKIKDVAVAQKLLEPTHFAVNRWVNRAIISPNAGLRPTRASDPHFAMFYQFKSFTYAFQETTMRYAMHEAEHGNFTAAAKLLHGVPIMIAADMMKAMVTGGGSMPGYMANWTLVDWISHGINRSGIGGTSSFITDMLGGNVVGTLAGPTVDHIVGAGKDILTGEVGHAIKQSLPIVKQLSVG